VNTYEALENELRGKEYHIDGDGKVTVMNKPNIDRFPR
jgi:hypothetical protein